MEERNRLYNILEHYHCTFSLDEGERGETNLVEFNVVTGECTPIKQAVTGYLLLHDKKLLYN